MADEGRIRASLSKLGICSRMWWLRSSPRRPACLSLKTTGCTSILFFPFLIADVDRFVMLPDGRKAILECKTAHYDMQFKWANGSVPRHYELQVRHYMAVMNIDVAFIACLFSNNENDFVWQKIERDLDEEEENTIMELEAFWRNYVLARVEPPLVEKPDAVLESLRRYFGPADKSEPSVDLDCKFLGSLKEILKLKEEKKVIDAQSKHWRHASSRSTPPLSSKWGLPVRRPVSTAVSASE